MVSGGALTALNPSTLPIENGFPLARCIEAVTGLKATLVNDAHAAGWGEYKFGAGRGFRNFMFVTVSTGVGGGLILEGRLQLGRTGLAGHVGHVSVPGAMTLCGCGRKGCLETVASGTAIARRFRDGSGRDVATPEVFVAASEGDTLAERVIDESAAALAVAFADAVATVDLDVIALGGGVGLATGFLGRVRKWTSQLPPVFRREIVRAQAGPDAGLIGAASLSGENFHQISVVDK
jgi:N-acylmannosamine kinase